MRLTNLLIGSQTHLEALSSIEKELKTRASVSKGRFLSDSLNLDLTGSSTVRTHVKHMSLKRSLNLNLGLSYRWKIGPSD